MRITGSLAAPEYALDTKALIRNQAGDKVREKKKELLDKAFDELGLDSTEGPGDAKTGDGQSSGEQGGDRKSPRDAAKNLLKGVLGGN